jgi:hypothetical protein
MELCGARLTRTYEVEFADGQRTELAANVIAENMFAQCDSEGNQYLLLAGIVDHRKDNSAVDKKDMYIKQGSNLQLRKATKGWSLCVEWKDGSTSWERLADLKESNPVEIADYSVAHSLESEPVFAWWVPFTLKRRNRIIAAVNKRYHKRTHKFGIVGRMPYGKKWLKSESLSKHWVTMNKCRQHSNRCTVIWYMTFKWRTFSGKLAWSPVGT